MDLVPASAGHVDAVLRLRDQAAVWLTSRGVAQWTPGELPRSVVERRVAAGQTHVLLDVDESIKATVTIDFADEHTWGERGADRTAGYIHTLIVRPDATGAGLGARCMRWSEAYIQSNGRTRSRLDCVESNAALQDWYRALGYRHAGRRDYGDVWFPVALFERDLDGP